MLIYEAETSEVKSVLLVGMLLFLYASIRMFSGLLFMVVEVECYEILGGMIIWTTM